MKNNMEAPHRSLGTLERNRLVAFSFCAALFGFACAIYLGAFSASELKEIPEWISAIAAAASAAISAFAVYLVAGTLKATVATLEITQRMAEAQSEAYDIEFRPQVLPDEVKVISARFVEDEEVEVALRFIFRNYGKMAALRVSGQIIAGDVRGDETVNMEEYTGFWCISMFRRSTLRPEGTFHERVVVRGKFNDGVKKLISPRLQYDDERGQQHFDIEKAYYFLRHEGDKFFIKEVGPFDVSPHANYDQEEMDPDQ